MTNAVKKQRSRNYPFLSLKKAIDRVRQLSREEGTNFTSTSVAKMHWNYGPKSSGGIRTVSALIQFGLLDEQGKGTERLVRVSKLATTILEHPDPRERKAALKDAALKPVLYREIWERYKEGLPSNQTLKWELTGKGDPSAGVLNKLAVDDFIGSFLDTLNFAGLTTADESEKPAEVVPDTSQTDGSEQPIHPKEGISVVAVSATTPEDFELPFQLGNGRQGVLRLPQLMTPEQWQKFESVIETTKNLRNLLVDDSLQDHESESDIT